MKTAICQHSGIEFESVSGRAKNHPALDTILKDAYKRGVYGETMDALKAVRQAGGYTTIEEYLALVNERIANAVGRRRAAEEVRREEKAQAEREANDRRAQRRIQNAQLRAAGFRWIGDWGMDNFDEYEEPSGRPPTHWYLYAPDEKEIDPAVALQIVAGQTTLEAARAAESAAKQEAQRRAAEAAAEEAAEQKRERAARAAVETIEVEHFNYRDFKRIYNHGSVTIFAGQVNGIPAGVVTRHTYDDDYYRYWCANPEAAGLIRVEQPEPGSFGETWRDFWGA